MKYKVILTDIAFNDLEEIKRRMQDNGKAIAKRYMEKVLERLSLLELFPYKGPSFENDLFQYASARYLVCLSHVAIYQVNEIAKCVYVLRVLSHFQDWRNIVNKNLSLKKEIIAVGSEVSLARLDSSMYYDVYRNIQNTEGSADGFGSLEEASDAVEVFMESYEKENGPFVYAILRNKDQANVGCVQLSFEEDEWRIGYWIGDAFSGHGYATEAIGLLLHAVAKPRGIKEVFALVSTFNKKSQATLLKCGFFVRKTRKDPHNSTSSTLCFSLLL